MELFPIEPKLPEGFQYVPAFLTAEEEALLLKSIEGIQFHTFVFQGYEAKRRVASFGYDYSFDSRKLSRGADIPKVFNPLIEKVSSFLAIDQHSIGEMLMTEYPVGAVINWHRDAPPFDVIIGISLRSECTMRFRPQNEKDRSRLSTISVTLQPRSLYLIKGESRTHWQHSTLPVKGIRYSITLRTLR